MEWVVIGGLCVAPIAILFSAGGPDAPCQAPRKTRPTINSAPQANEFSASGAYTTSAATEGFV